MLLSDVSLRRCRIVKLVRALRKGWIKTTAERRAVQQEPEAYLLWEDDGLISSKTSHGESLPLSEILISPASNCTMQELFVHQLCHA